MISSDESVINSNAYAELSVEALETALSIDISGGVDQYVNYLVTEISTAVSRVSDLFSCFLTTQVALSSYTEVEAAFKLAWTTKFES